LADHRAEQIAHLHTYGEKRQFPLNVTNAPNFHMFCDPKGRLCAVAKELVRVQVWPVLPEPEARKLERKPATAEERMNVAVAKHVVEMEEELKANTEASLVIAVERYLAAYPNGT
jgi:hypothetical protein